MQYSLGRTLRLPAALEEPMIMVNDVYKAAVSSCGPMIDTWRSKHDSVGGEKALCPVRSFR